MNFLNIASGLPSGGPAIYSNDIELRTGPKTSIIHYERCRVGNQRFAPFCSFMNEALVLLLNGFLIIHIHTP